MVNNRFFLPEQEFPLWNCLVALIGETGEVKLSRIRREGHRLLCLFSLHGSEYIALCAQSKRGPWVNHASQLLSYNSVSGSEYGALFVLDLSLCDYVIFNTTLAQAV